MEQGDQLIFSNQLGSVTTKRLTLNHSQGQENIPIDRITSVSFQSYRFWFLGLLGAILGLFLSALLIVNLEKMGESELIITFPLALIFIVLAVWGLLPRYKIVVSTGGNNRKPLKVKRSLYYEGEQLAEAINEAVFNK